MAEQNRWRYDVLVRNAVFAEIALFAIAFPIGVADLAMADPVLSRRMDELDARTPDAAVPLVGGAVLLMLGFLIAGWVGILLRRRWGRTFYALSIVVSLPTMTAFTCMLPTISYWPSSSFESLIPMLTGAILVLIYIHPAAAHHFRTATDERRGFDVV